MKRESQKWKTKKSEWVEKKQKKWWEEKWVSEWEGRKMKRNDGEIGRKGEKINEKKENEWVKME